MDYFINSVIVQRRNKCAQRGLKEANVVGSRPLEDVASSCGSVVAAERPEDAFRAGYQEAAAEAVRYFVEVQGYGSADGLGAHLASHLQRHCDIINKGEGLPREKLRTHPGSSSETASSSSSSHGFAVSRGVIATAPPAPPPYDYEPDHAYPMDCDRGTPSLSGNGTGPGPGVELDVDDEPLDARRREPDYLHSYKFKNSIERRFSRSQDCEAAEVARATNGINGKSYGHKRRRAIKSAHSTSTSTEDTRDTSPQDTSSESPHHHHPYEKPPPPPAQFVPVFALNALGKYYVPLSVEYSCLARYGGGAALGGAAPAVGGGGGGGGGALHPVTIHVNFQPCLPLCRLKSEPPA